MKRIDVAIAIVLRESKVLIARRKAGQPLAGYWEFPGGKCHRKESLEVCLARELWEEVEIVAKPVLSFSSITFNYPHESVCLHPFLCIHQSGEPKAIGCQEVRWIDPAQLREYRFPEANGPLIDQLVLALPPNSWSGGKDGGVGISELISPGGGLRLPIRGD
jgi:mutator protein MutT